MEHALEVILLADSSKAHEVSFTRSGRLEKVRILITDSLMDRKLSRKLRKRGLEVVCA
jgi:DeoR/GlpR family transcriptional regulator of sugar metabolism